MLFNSYSFILGFLPLTFLVYHGLRNRGWVRGATAFLAAMSLAFYGWWNPVYLGLLVPLMAANFFVVQWLVALPLRQSGLRRLVLIVGLAGNLAVLGYFKYAVFIAENMALLLGTHAEVAAIVLPLGISFFTFQKIGLLVDAYRGRVGRLDPLGYSLFVTFFPQLIAGPIVHHSEVMPQFAAAKGRVKARDLALGATIFSIGLAKKVLLADNVAAFVSPVFDAAAKGLALGAAEAWTGAIAYTLQLYFDFSGYSDMAVGAALLFGIRLPVNFASPYKALSIVDFWRRWHMTLSRFLRDYVYVPLGGNRHGPLHRYVNLFATMLLGGLWHGAGWTFVAWGALHGALLVANHAWRAWRAAHISGAPSWAHRLMSGGLTFLCVVIAWVLFRAEDFASALSILWAMAGLNGVAGHDAAIDATAALPIILPLLALVWLAPNTQQLTGYEPSARVPADLRAAMPEGVSWAGWRWQASPAWAISVGGLFALALLSLTKASEFLYFHF